MRTFRRPRSASDIGAIKVQVSRAVQKKQLRQIAFNYYYKRGWFEELGDAFTMKDACLHFMLAFAGYLRTLESMDRKDPETMLKLSRAMIEITYKIRAVADQLAERADVVASQTSIEETEATD